MPVAVEWFFNLAVKYNIMLYTTQQWLRQNMNQRLNSQKHAISGPYKQATGCLFWVVVKGLRPDLEGFVVAM